MVRIPILLAVLVCPAFASAHGIVITVRNPGERIVVEVTFDSNDPADGAEITVTTRDGRIIERGMTDEHGAFSFPVPAPGEYRIAVDAGSGHRAQTTMLISGEGNVESIPSGSRSPFGTWGGLLAGILAISFGTAIWMYVRSRRMGSK